MRYIRYAILALIAIFLVTLALANREFVTLRLMPDDLAALIRYPAALNSISIPIFGVIFAGVLLGLFLGFVAEWLREHKYRAQAAREHRENKRLTKEVAAMKTEKADGDDVLALLDDAGPAR